MKNTFILSMLLACNAFSQPLLHEWSNPYGGNNNQYSQSISGNGSGEIITVGFYNDEFHYEDADDLNIITTNGLSDVFIQKTNSSGGVIWAKGIGGTGIDYAFDSFIDSDDNVYVTGVFQNTVDFDPNVGIYELTSSGTNPDVYVLKLNSDGDFIWAKSFQGSGYDYGKAITVDNSGNVYVSGEFQNTVDFDPNVGIENKTSNGIDDVFLVKLNSNGDLIWANTFGGTMRDYGADLALDNVGNIILVGTFRDSVNFTPSIGENSLTALAENDVYILKTTTDGAFIWVKQFKGEEGVDALAVAINSNNEIFIGGNYDGLTDFHPGEDEIIFSSGAEFSGYLVQLNSVGDLLYIQTFSSSGYIAISQLMITDNQDICIGGFFTDYNGIETPVDVPPFVSAGNEDIFLAVYDPNLNFKWSGHIGGTENITIRGIAPGESNSIYIGGMFQGTMDMDPNLTTQNKSGIGSELFLLKLDGSTLNLKKSEESLLTVFPNPSEGIFTFSHLSSSNNQTLSIHSINGLLMYQQEITTSSTSIDLTQLPKGIYIATIGNDHERIIIH